MTIDDKPVIVFIDTSAFERQNFAFGGDLLTAILESCNDSLMEIVMPDVTADEIRRRIRTAAKSAEKAMKTARKDARLLGHDRDLWKKIREHSYYDDLGEAVVSEFDEFLKRANVTMLHIDGVRPSDVFQKYFSVRPPFSQGDKEKEFPDAFAIETLLRLSEERGKKVYVVSSDNDFTKACSQCGSLVHWEHIESAIEFSLRTPDALVDACHEWLHDNLTEVFHRAEERLKQVRFSLDAPSGRIYSTEYLDMEVCDEAVVELEETHGVVAASVRAQVGFNVDYATEGESYYDVDDRLVIPYEDVQRDLEVYLLFPLRLSLNIEMRDIRSIREITFDIADEADITPDDGWEFEIQSE